MRVWDDTMKYGVQFGFMPVAPPIYQYQRFSNPDDTMQASFNGPNAPLNNMYTPAGSMDDSEQGTDEVEVVETHVDESQEQIEKERQGSAVNVKERDQEDIARVVDNVAETRLASENISTASGGLDDGEHCGTSENDGVTSEARENVHEANGQEHDEEHSLDNTNRHDEGTFDEHNLQQDEGDSATEQPRDPMADTTTLAEQLVGDLVNLPDSGYEIAQQHPETVLSLQLIMALGRALLAGPCG